MTLYLDVDDLGHLPELNEKTDGNTDDHHGVGVVVENVQKDDHALDHADEDRPHRQTFERLARSPELHICQNQRKKK